jgi:hypothetical protein
MNNVLIIFPTVLRTMSNSKEHRLGKKARKEYFRLLFLEALGGD